MAQILIYEQASGMPDNQAAQMLPHYVILKVQSLQMKCFTIVV